MYYSRGKKKPQKYLRWVFSSERENKITYNIINLFDVYNTSQNTDTVKADLTKKPRYKSSFM